METKNELTKLDGLIKRLTDLRDMTGEDCHVVCGNKPRWNVGDNLAYYGFTSDAEGEVLLGEVIKVWFDVVFNDWAYTFIDGFNYLEEELLENECYKKE